ncbi:MAG: hypothetical protein FWG80_03355 [Alphaproteobacteria bacterium]|nr:hypothetical protein [Alphaproteobacteria bacterium]
MLEQRGSNLLETLLAIGLVAAMTPFVYNRVIETSRDIADVATAKQIFSWKEPVNAYIRKNQADWPDNAEIELDEEEMLGMIGLKERPEKEYTPVVAFLDKYQHLGGTNIDSYIVFPSRFDGLRMRRIAKRLGADAVVVDDSGMAYSAAAGWSVESELFQENDLVYRVTVTLARDDSWLYLHRLKSEYEILNTMERDLLMSRNNLVDADAVDASVLDSKMISAWFATADMFMTEDAVFPDGASLDGTNAEFSSIRATGDVIGFRNITALRMEGSGGRGAAGGVQNWSSQGNIVADRTTIENAVHVGRNLNLKSSFSAIVSGFSGVTAHSLAVPFVSTEYLRFADGFGLSISNELSASYDSTGPLRFGNWSFPSATAPKFSGLVLRKSGGSATVQAPNGFDKIIGKGWKELESKNAE